MNIDRIQSELIRLYGGRPQGVRGGTARPAGESAAGGAPDAATAPRADGVVLSDRAGAVARLFGVVQSLPDVREELVAELREAVQSGSYEPRDEEVARRLLGLVGAE
jgi:flagellar biosynthesis anti-sigma factor FlgM